MPSNSLFIACHFSWSPIQQGCQSCWNKHSHISITLSVSLARFGPHPFLTHHLPVRFVSLYVLVYGLPPILLSLLHWKLPWPDALKGGDGLSFHIPLHIATSFVAIPFATSLPSSCWQLPCGPTLCLLNTPQYFTYLLVSDNSLQS